MLKEFIQCRIINFQITKKVLRIYSNYPKVNNVLAKNVFHEIFLLLSFTFSSNKDCDEFETDVSDAISCLSVSILSLSWFKDDPISKLSWLNSLLFFSIFLSNIVWDLSMLKSVELNFWNTFKNFWLATWFSSRVGSCTSELQLKVNCRP